ncbi:MAG: response regulator transcription factor [Peptostreptococcaceae bacterium]|nr:response regulator transcription factor [Peptostreptococcaceae bacterium]
MHKILIVEDEPAISRIVEKYLIQSNYECTIASDGFIALELFSKNSYDLILLDVMMPGIDGFKVLETIRETSDLPVIMLTARELEEDRLSGFTKGADDYVIKPFSPLELVKRVDVFIKRIYGSNEISIRNYGPFVLDDKEKTMRKNNEIIDLTSAEYLVISVLLEHKNQILTRNQIIETAFSLDYEGYDRTIDTYIKRIRSKIEDDPKKPKYLQTKYGAGYVFII